MKLLVFAHVPPPHHGQAVMVELMLRGLGGNKPQIAQISQMKQVDRAVPGAIGSQNAQSASFLKDDIPQRDAEDAEKNLKSEKTEKLKFSDGMEGDGKGRDVRPRVSASGGRVAVAAPQVGIMDDGI